MEPVDGHSRHCLEAHRVAGAPRDVRDSAAPGAALDPPDLVICRRLLNLAGPNVQKERPRVAPGRSQVALLPGGSVAPTLERRLQLSLVHLRTSLDVEALRLPVELLFGSLVTHRHDQTSLRRSCIALPGRRISKHAFDR